MASKKPTAKPLDTASLIDGMFDADTSMYASESMQYAAFSKAAKALPLNDVPFVAQFLVDMCAKYGPERADAAAQYKTMFNNCCKIECGGTLKKVHVQGRGRAVLLEILSASATIRDLKKALADGKPEGLKPAPKAKPVNAGAKPESKAKPGKVEKFTQSEAFKAAVAILQKVELFLKPGTDADLIGRIDAVVADLKKAA